MNLQRGFSRVRLLPVWLLLHLTIITQTVSSETRVVCYYTNWSVYRPGTAKFSPQNINPYLCTHLIYAFGGFTKENSLKPFDKYQDIEKGGYAKFTGLKTYNKNLKTMLAIGGWNEGSSRFSPMVASGDRRKELVKNTIKFLRQNHFDGLDLDWEYPNFRDGGKSRDKDNYAQLVQELREEFNRESEKTGRPRLLLTMAVPAGIEYINKGYDVPKLMKYLDWMNILSYDYHSAFEPAVNHHSPLFPIVEDDEYNFEGDLNIDYTIKHYMKAGADPKKLVLGIPTYGRSYTLFNPDANELGAPADGPGEMGDATRENGYLAFYEICENIKDNDWTVMQPNPNAMGPYAYKENQWVSYDDEQIARKKSEYVVEMGLGGIMFWSIDNDDFRGNCYGKPYPLIEAAKEALINAASGKTDDNLVSAPSKPRKPITRGRTRPGISINSAGGASTQQRVQNSGGRQGSGDSSQNNGNSNAGTKKRIRLGSRNKARTEESLVTRPRGSSGRRRRPTTTTTVPTTLSTSARTVATTPMYKTPEPPTTPDPGGDFKCEEDGFFPHPRDCKKYFWCLSGPGDTGIIAHQFTCPAGLYFNKAADSCDYTQNVLCNKKVKTTTTPTSTTSTTTTTTTQRPSTTTRRTPARITAATSRTSFYYTTTTSTTPESDYYDEYEYEDEEFEDDVPPTIKKGELDAEEDPKVIKELIDLIRKVGGVEELEKYLKLQEDGSVGVTSSGSGSTTPATISRSLYERVLSRATANAEKTNTGTSSTSTITKGRGTLSYSILNRNSRPGPQSLGTASESVAATGAATRENSEDGTVRRVRPQYTTINRQRPSTERNVDEDDTELAVKEEEQIEEDVEEPVTRSRLFTGRKTSIPEYVTIRRTRPPSITENADEDEVTTKFIARGRQRGIPGETDVDETDVTQAPEYVTIRRSRPSIEEPTTSKYTTILRRRPSTETSENTVSSTDIPASQRRRPVPNEPDNLSFDDNGDSTKKRRPGSLINNDSTDVDISTDSILNQTDSESKRRGSGTSNNEEQSDSEVKRTRPVLTNVDDSKQFSNYDTIQRKPGNLNVEENTDRNSSTDSNIKHTIPTVQLINEEHQSSIKRPTTQSSISQDTTDVSFVEKEARRRGTTINYEDISSSRYRSTTLSAAESTTLVSDEKITLSITDNDTNTTEPGTATEITTYSIQDSSSTLSTEAITETTTGFSSSEGTTKSPSILTDRTNQIGDSDVSTSSEKATPQLFRPRPFATRNRSTTTVKPTTSEATEGAVRKNNTSRPLFFRRPSLKFSPGKATLTTSTSTPRTTGVTHSHSAVRTPSRRRYTGKEAQATTANQVVVTTTPKPRFKFATRKPFLRTTAAVSSSMFPVSEEQEDDDFTDQTLESSNQKPRPLNDKSTSSTVPSEETSGGELPNSTELADIALSLHSLHTAPLPSTTTTEKMSHLYDRVKTRKRTRISTTARPQLSSTTPKLVSYASSRRRRPQPFERVTPGPIKFTTGSYTPITVEYDYYDEGDVRVFGQLPANSKVLIHNTGGIQCLDQGNFPHPVSCKKFISCAKMENGNVIGWEYTCPNGLSFDPVGGICNWSAGLGCKV